MNPSKIAEILISEGLKVLKEPRSKSRFTDSAEANDFLNNIETYPHGFVLGCIMDRQMPAERAWIIPFKVGQEIGGFEFSRYAALEKDYLIRLFEDNTYHRFNEIMAECFYSAVQRIKNQYSGDASKIWTNTPRSVSIVKRFLEFKGAGIKIATMAVNILVREFKMPVADLKDIEVSPDTHIKRVFERAGLVQKDASNDEIIYAARELNPDYPGIVDIATWKIGRHFCKPDGPLCNECLLSECCGRNL